MRLSPITCVVLILMLLACGCGNSPSASTAPAAGATNSISSSVSPTAPLNETDAIKAAIDQHLLENKGINLSVMDMKVGKITVTGDQAQADTEFRLKQGGTSMLITYFLERHGGGWLVVRNQPSGAGQFAHPPMDKVHSGAASAVTSKQDLPNQDFPDLSKFLRKHPSPNPN